MEKDALRDGCGRLLRDTRAASGVALAQHVYCVQQRGDVRADGVPGLAQAKMRVHREISQVNAEYSPIAQIADSGGEEAARSRT